MWWRVACEIRLVIGPMGFNVGDPQTEDTTLVVDGTFEYLKDSSVPYVEHIYSDAVFKVLESVVKYYGMGISFFYRTSTQDIFCQTEANQMMDWDIPLSR